MTELGVLTHTKENLSQWILSVLDKRVISDERIKNTILYINLNLQLDFITSCLFCVTRISRVHKFLVCLIPLLQASCLTNERKRVSSVILMNCSGITTYKLTKVQNS